MNNYKGISFPFDLNGRGGITTSELTREDLTRIKESILQIILTYPGERVMEPEFGCRLRDFVFQNIDGHMLGMVDWEIRRAIDKWEKRVEILDIAITSSTDNLAGNAVNIDVYFKVIKYDVADSVTVSVKTV